MKEFHWDNIAEHYLRLIEKKGGGLTSSAEIKKFNYHFADDPYEALGEVALKKDSVEWNSTHAIAFDGQNVIDVLKNEGAGDGYYCVYVDRQLQLNVKISE